MREPSQLLYSWKFYRTERPLVDIYIWENFQEYKQLGPFDQKNNRNFTYKFQHHEKSALLLLTF